MTKRTGLKLGLLLLAVLIIAGLLVFVFLWKKDTGEPKPKPPIEAAVVGERITRAEAIRLFTYFFYTDSSRLLLDRIISFSDTDTSKWYDTYLNAAVTIGFLSDAGEKVHAEENLTCGDFRELLLQICELTSTDKNSLMARLPERLYTAKNRDEVLLEEFLYLYRYLAESVSQQDRTESSSFPLEWTSLYILNATGKGAGDGGRFISETGAEYRAEYFQDYSDFFSIGVPIQVRPGTQNTMRSYANPQDYIDYRIEALVSGREIVMITGESAESTGIENALILDAEGSLVHAFINGQKRDLQTELPLAAPMQEMVADIVITNRKITSFTVKPDTLNAKVLVSGTEEVELEGYGKLSFTPDYKIYKLYDSLEMERTNSILVGYSNVTFVLSEGKICAALIYERIRAENIRVLISVDKTTNYWHKNISLTSDTGFLVMSGIEVQEYAAGETVSFSYEDFPPDGPRVSIKPLTESGSIRVTSILRSYGAPKYRGVLEIAPTAQGLLLVNELSIEEYLYSVVPSEMPTGHGEEALKVQAVCARSYAYKQLLANRYSTYGAHIDDTVNCQVYNNVSENNSSIYAVKDTYGKVMTYGNSIVTAYYFSTSSGYTSGIEDVWAENPPVEYFTGKPQLTAESVNALQEATIRQGYQLSRGEVLAMIDLSGEEDFRTFLDDSVVRLSLDTGVISETVETYDDDFSWYRWNVAMDAGTVSEQIDKTIRERYLVNRNDILTLTDRGGTFQTPLGVLVEGTFSPCEISTVGLVTDIRVLSRAKSGIITELLVTGTKNTVILRNQTNVRTLLAPVSTTINLSNDVKIEGFSLMPSAYFYVEAELSDNNQTRFHFFGGGYGHGVGMSQNGVKGLVDAGYSYEEILKHFYQGINLGFIY